MRCEFCGRPSSLPLRLSVPGQGRLLFCRLACLSDWCHAQLEAEADAEQEGEA